MATSEVPQTPGEQFRDARKLAGLKQRDVAKAAGVSVSYVSMVESSGPTNKGALALMALSVGASYGSFFR